MTAAWGHAPTPLVPRAIRETWPDREVPDAVRDVLPSARCYAHLGSEAWGDASAVPESVLDAVAEDVRALGVEVERIVVLRAPWPTMNELRRLPLRGRTTNVAIRVFTGSALDLGGQLTAGDLLRVTNLGIKTLLDLLCVLEAAPPRSAEGSPPTAGSAWGLPPMPLVPASIRQRFGDRPAPPAVNAALGRTAFIGDLDATFWEHVKQVDGAVLDQLVGWFHALVDAVDDLVLIPADLMIGQDVLPLSTDAARLVGRDGLLGVRGRTVGSLLDNGFDARALLEAGSVAEGSRIPDPDELRSWLEESWTHQVSNLDPRFEGLADRRTIAERIDALLTAGGSHDEHAALVHDIEAARARVGHLVNEPLDEGLAAIVVGLSRTDGDRAEAVLARFGLLGDPPSTLEAAGKIAGLTRERIRQIETWIKKKWPPHPVFLPAMDRAIELVRSEAPLDAEELGTLLVAEGLASRPFGPEAFLKALSLAGREAEVGLDTVGQLRTREQLVTTAERRETLASVRDVLRRTLKPFMIGELTFAERVCTDHGVTFGGSLGDELDELGVVWLGDGWFWMRGDEHRSHSPLAELVLAILAVGDPEGVELGRC